MTPLPPLCLRVPFFNLCLLGLSKELDVKYVIKILSLTWNLIPGVA